MSSDIVTLARDGYVATVTINNPAKRNALTFAAWERLLEILKELQADDDLRCVLFTGAGDHFAAGADISEFAEKRKNSAQAETYGILVAEVLDRLANLKHPTVAVIRGACTGGGFEIVTCCDIRIAADDARLGMPINRLGHAYAYPELAAALSAIPAPVIFELVFEGRIFDAQESFAKGVLNRVYPGDQLEAEASAAARRICQGAPLSNRDTKRFLRRLMRPEAVSDAENREGYALCDSEDYQEGVRAFLAKEKPNFKGH